ncbi:glycosyltransferase [Leptolyngbya sp. FACHB-711]|uniref:glycosyltransferase n=1 Tax=unclassified Leptolyngbya TaxID=2650499 RepID=UPI0016898B3B|nr:glycosyltransferase [Leptolyngbya sp. FACHB-711]MBD2028348.1 glycosyltransferase family 1 protein [Leptolyngbya sp. FACHB-711]
MKMMNKAANQYYLYLHQGQKPVPWYPPDPYPLDWVDYTYFGNVFKAMEEKLEVGGLIFYFTWNSLKELPSYGKNVVVIVAGDEWCRIPTYCDKVLAVFKCYGTKPILGCNPFLHPSYLNILALIQFLRIGFYRLPGLLSHALLQLKYLQRKSSEICLIYDIPLGYNRQLELPVKDLEEREYDVSFAGSIEHGTYSVWSLKHLFDTPKSFSRRKMMSSIKTFDAKHPELKIELTVTPSFGSSKDVLDKESYSQRMINTKICLVPRGTSFETFRFFEAMRYGCIVITEALPTRWFYDGSPAIQINDWDELEEILTRLLENKHLMQEKHQESLKWWETRCSEAVVGSYIAKQLNSLAYISK